MFIFHVLALPIGYLFVRIFSLICGHSFINFRVYKVIVGGDFNVDLDIANEMSNSFNSFFLR